MLSNLSGSKGERVSYILESELVARLPDFQSQSVSAALVVHLPHRGLHLGTRRLCRTDLYLRSVRFSYRADLETLL